MYWRRKVSQNRICYILLEYSPTTDRHYHHIYEFIEDLSQHVETYLIIENTSEKFPSLTNPKVTYVCRNRLKFIRKMELFWSILNARLKGYKVFYSHYSSWGAIFASLVTKLTGGKTLLWHCIMAKTLFADIGAKQYSYGVLIFNLTLKLIDYLVTGSEFMADYYTQQCHLPRPKIKIVPIYINLERFNRQRYQREQAQIELNIPRARKVVLFVHGLERGKGALNLPEIIRYVKNRIPEVYFLIVGDGSRKQAIEKDIEREEGWQYFIRLVGRVPNKEIMKYYAAADLFIMPSEFEEASRTLLEAMAMGIPFVATDGGGGVIEYTNPEQQKYVVPPKNNKIFSEKVIELLFAHQEREELAQEGIDLVKRFSLPQIREKFLEVILGKAEKDLL